MPINRKYGWAPDLPDQRDHLYSAPQPVLAKLPPKKDLRSGCPPVYDQGQLGSCTANAISGAIQFEQKKQGVTLFMPSRLFIYYNERAIEGTVNSDAGAQIRDGVKSVSARFHQAEPFDGLHCRRLSVRLRLHRLRIVRGPGGRKNRRREHACTERESCRRPCRSGGGLRRCGTALRGSKFMGERLGDQRLLHNPVYVSDHHQSCR
jgi:hypothetical protein